jgi:hypothetical protein
MRAQRARLRAARQQRNRIVGRPILAADGFLAVLFSAGSLRAQRAPMCATSQERNPLTQRVVHSTRCPFCAGSMRADCKSRWKKRS